MNIFARLCVVASTSILLAGVASAQWTKIANPNFTYGAGQALLLTDGSVLVHDESAAAKGTIGSDWKRLIPDAFGSYTNGTWVAAGPLQSGYGPLYFASAVLADGRVVIFGGEYNLNDNSGNAVETNQGAIYDPATDSWSSLSGPGWSQIGDAPSSLLPDGRFMIGDINSTRTAVLDPVALTWSAIGSGKADNNSEEGWTLLSDGTILTVDCSNGNHAEKFVIGSATWISAGNTIDYLPAGLAGYVPELGPAVRRPDGTVIAFGASGFNDIYTPPANPLNTGSWATGPSFTNPYDVADGPATLLPSGNVLVAASPGIYNAPTHYYEFDGVNLNQVADSPNAPNISSFQARMLPLPSGQVLVTDGSNDVEIYTPGGGPQNAWRPTISSPTTIASPGSTAIIYGTQLNGLSQAAAYGDDAAAATNYPLVRITNNGTGHVFYCKTHGHSTMSVATGSAIVSTHYDVPLGIEGGASSLQVVANGIASAAINVTVQADAGAPTTTASLSGPAGSNGWYTGAVTVTLSATDPDGAGDVAMTFYTVDGGAQQNYSGPFSVSGDAVHTITFWSVDHAGLEELPHPSQTIKIDGTNPTLTFGSQTPAANGFGWNNTAVDVPYTTGDNLSGVDTATPGSPVHFASEGANQTQTVTVTDKAGNSATFTTPAVNIDLTAPVTTSSLSGPAGKNGWYVGSVKVSLSPSDNLSGVNQTFYTIDGGSSQTYGGSAFTVTGDGIHTVTYWSTDKAGNTEATNTITIKIDTTPPTITINSPTFLWAPNHKYVTVTLTGSITDQGSGVDPATPAYVVVDEYGRVQPSGSITLGANGAYTVSFTLQASRLGTDTAGRTYTITVSASDLAGNKGSAKQTIIVPHDQS